LLPHQLGNQASIKEDGLSGWLVGQALKAVGTVLQLGTGAAEGAELLESQRPGTLGLIDRLQGADLVLNDAKTAVGAAGTLAAVGATVRGKIHGYFAAREQRQASRQFLRKRGLAKFETTGFVNGIESFRRDVGANSVEVGIRSFGEKAQARREAVEAGYRQKPMSVKDKSGADAIVHKTYHLEPEYHGRDVLGPRQSRVDYVSDTDIYM
jgi:hypothetical protein